jgi:hypothetical protein
MGGTSTTYNRFHLFILNDDCPWTCADIGEGLSIEHMQFPATPVQDLFLSPPMMVMYLRHQKTNDRRKSKQLAVMAGYHNGYHRYFYLGTTHFDELVKAINPALVYYKKAKETFEVAFSDINTGHISPTSVDFAKVYLNDNGTMNDIMDVLVSEVVVALDWIKENVGTESFNHVLVEKMVKE